MAGGTRGGRGNVRKRRAAKKFSLAEHYKYPASVGNDTYTDNICFNSHDSSEYAIERMDAISETTHEPFCMFEFMSVNDEKKYKNKAENKTYRSDNLPSGQRGSEIQFVGGKANENVYRKLQKAKQAITAADTASGAEAAAEEVGFIQSAVTGVKNFADAVSNTVRRDYAGSVSLYMPTDIQVNDQFVYNDDTRTVGALMNEILRHPDGIGSGFNDIVANPTTLTSPAALAIAAGSIGKILPGKSTDLILAVTGGALGTAIRTELQRGSGKIANPNELTAYGSTALRTFSFNWTILPDSEYESDQASGLIKMFRKSAHAKKDSSLIVTVPDHVIVSFHGAKDMIQLPPCVIENVSVTYNPNNSSFFRRNNAPVEIGFGIQLKELTPIYQADIERGY